MRADARKNYDHLLTVARALVAEQGAEASLRDIARRADVGLATLYRHFPTREALLEALLRTNLDELTRKAADLGNSMAPDEALALWLPEAVGFVRSYNGVVAVMAAALDNTDSALHAACIGLRAAGARLLERAQAEGTARNDLDGIDLFGIIGALGWLGDQPAFAARADRLVDIVVAGTILQNGE